MASKTIQIADKPTLDAVKVVTDTTNTNVAKVSNDCETLKNYSTIMMNKMGLNASGHLLLGYRVNKSDSNPTTRIEYLYDAEGRTPARMDYVGGKFNAGDWGSDVWFMNPDKQYPCMLYPDGTEAYKLDPTNYALKAAGGASALADTTTTLNAMSCIPLIWTNRYQSDNYEYYLFSDIQWDDNFVAFAHMNASKVVKDKKYLSMFKGSLVGSKLRSLSGQQPIYGHTASEEIAYAQANGSLWNIKSWSERELITELLLLISRNENSQAAFGNGNLNYQSTATPTFGVLQTGSLKESGGPFMGYNDLTHQVKVFHMEGFWADQWETLVGYINNNGDIQLKPYPPYNLVGTDFISTGVKPNNPSATITDTSNSGNGYISGTVCTKYGRVPAILSGSDSTYLCDYCWYNNKQIDVALAGGGCYLALRCGCSSLALDSLASASHWYFGACPSCEET